MSQHYNADTQHLFINFILTAPLTPAQENTNTTIASCILLWLDINFYEICNTYNEIIALDVKIWSLMALAWSILKGFTDNWLRICAYKKQQSVTANRSSLIVLKAVPLY